MIHFSKMHGAGNDYIFIDCTRQTIDQPAELAQRVSHRHTGIGSDGLVLILPSGMADFRMRIFNADGSEAEMCGNATRCVGKFVYEKGLTDKRKLSIETLAGVKNIELDVRSGKVFAVTVDMGKPQTPEDICLSFDGGEYGGDLMPQVKLTLVDMGNPHAICWVDDVDATDVAGWGKNIEYHPYFAHRTNVEFAHIMGCEDIRMRVWERGSGETMACGTGATATFYAAYCAGKVGAQARVHLLGGTLLISIREDGHLLMTGPAEWCCEGVV